MLGQRRAAAGRRAAVRLAPALVLGASLALLLLVGSADCSQLQQGQGFCSTTAWPIGGPVTRCAPGVCNAAEGEAPGQLLALSAPNPYTHGGAYTPAELSIADCCLVCRSTAGCAAWTYCNAADGCGGAGGCSAFVAAPANAAALRTASSRPACQGGRWPHAHCALKQRADGQPAGIQQEATRQQQQASGAPRPLLMGPGQVPGGGLLLGDNASGWVSGVLTDVPGCPSGLPHLLCSACAGAANPSACHTCAAQFVGPAPNAARACVGCASLASASDQAACIADVSQGGGSGCLRWQQQPSGPQQEVLDGWLSSRCYQCSTKAGPQLGYICARCFEEGVDPGACLDCMSGAQDQRAMLGCVACSRAGGGDQAACQACLKYPAVAADASGYASLACGGCSRVPAAAAGGCWQCMRDGRGHACAALATQGKA